VLANEASDGGAGVSMGIDADRKYPNASALLSELLECVVEIPCGQWADVWAVGVEKLHEHDTTSFLS
jgi:hypothetical protein